MQMTRKRVSSLALPQAIIFLELRRGIRAAKSDSDLIVHRRGPSHAGEALEELICENCLPFMSENSSNFLWY